ncbi:aspartate-semialdehyde dehydrogenase [Candidatus Binatus sp.]|jgi:aspartate-semialdehyde dehydrogenase|uniref:aspartate-semialdehyde dehydrogenase n=1 Tax=Candidatus Binatus sp. TaxID=2811406 RepID=UPI003BEB230A
MASGQRIAVVGATGAVGQTTLKILEQRKFPIRELRAYASERSAGKTVTFAGEPITVRRLDAGSFKGIDIALFSAGSAQSREFAPIAVKAGAIVVDKSSAFRMDPDVPLVVPEINAGAARNHKGIVACPNCTTIVTVMPLKPIHDLGRLRRVVATSFQAVSGAGVNGVAELRDQTIAWSRGEPIKAKFFQHQIAFNLIPAGNFVEGGYTDEEIKLVNEIRKILEQPELLISPTTVRVPVFTAHSISVNAETETKISAADAREAFAHFPGIRLFDDPAHNRYPMPIIVEGQDDCFVGRIREDLSCPNALNFWVAGDQLRKGAALNGIQIAELLIGGR